MKTMIIDKIAWTDLDLAKKSIYHEREKQAVLMRLYELGLRPGLQIKILNKISFQSVTVIQFDQTRLALNEQELACLHGR